MIKRIKIDKFGVFNNFKGNVIPEFEALNIIYGRNYSGKTTLSRIFRLLQKRNIEEVADNKFEFTTTCGTINETNLNNHSLDVVVYNSDFVKDNLSWIHDPNGDIKPFTILGEDNKKEIAVIEQIKKEIDTKEGIGLLAIIEELENKELELNKELKRITNRKDDLCKTLATEIKGNTKFFIYDVDGKSFDITHIKKLIDLKDSIVKLNETEINILEEEATSKTLPPLQEISNPCNEFFKLVINIQLLLSKSIDFKNKINELLNNSNRSEWVRNGLIVNKDSGNCFFCGNVISDERIKTLQSHYDKEYESLLSDLSKLEEKLKEELKIDYNKFLPEITSFYSEFKDAIIYIKDKIKEMITKIKIITNELILKIQEKRKNASIAIAIDESIFKLNNEFTSEINDLNKIIDLSNMKGANITALSSIARKKLRENRVLSFLETSGYIDINNNIDELTVKLYNANLKLEKVKENKNELEERIKEIESRLQDQSAGAVLVNQFLKHYFGHSRLELKAISNGEKATNFIIYREGVKANNLSEGECSLISFCYFIASIKDKFENSNSSSLVVFIDDPISSLDSSHVFFVFGLIDALIAPKIGLLQLFVSTHNLDFLKYLKRLSVASYHNRSNYIISRYQKGSIQTSKIECMPSYLSNYATEFNFLFKEIYDLSRDDYPGDKAQFFLNRHTSLYSFSNNARKFLECYLFYKFPGTQEPIKELNKLLDPQEASRVNRIVNEYSHLTSIDRGMVALEFEELEKCAKIIMDLVKREDENQFNSLVSSC